MPKYYDLNLTNKDLQQKSHELGFSFSFTAEVFSINSKADIAKIKGKFPCIESHDSGLLREAIKRTPYSLVNPIRAKNFDRDSGLLRDAIGKAAFEIPISALVSAQWSERSKLIARLTTFLKNCVKLRAEYVFTTRARTEAELKSPREIIALASLFGLSYEQAQQAMSATPEAIIAKAQLIANI